MDRTSIIFCFLIFLQITTILIQITTILIQIQHISLIILCNFFSYLNRNAIFLNESWFLITNSRYNRPSISAHFHNQSCTYSWVFNILKVSSRSCQISLYIILWQTNEYVLRLNFDWTDLSNLKIWVTSENPASS